MKSKESSWQKLRFWLIVGLIIIIIGGGVFLFSQTYLKRFPISGSSMEPTIHNKDMTIIFRTKKVKYDDVVILWMPDDRNPQYLIKRVIGLPGDKIDIKVSEEDGYFHVYRNGERLREDYIKEPITENYYELSLTVPEGKLFFLGDNRMHSHDSHEGNTFADINNIQGVVFFRYREGFKDAKFL